MWWWVFALLTGGALATFIGLGVQLNAKGKKLKTAMDVLSQQLEQLATAAETPAVYSAPENNVLSNPVDTTKAWLDRRASTERKKAERQRRLINRLTKRK
jgi:hypothetical protein